MGPRLLYPSRWRASASYEQTHRGHIATHALNRTQIHASRWYDREIASINTPSFEIKFQQIRISLATNTSFVRYRSTFETRFLVESSDFRCWLEEALYIGCLIINLSKKKCSTRKICSVIIIKVYLLIIFNAVENRIF